MIKTEIQFQLNLKKISRAFFVCSLYPLSLLLFSSSNELIGNKQIIQFRNNVTWNRKKIFDILWDATKCWRMKNSHKKVCILFGCNFNSFYPDKRGGEKNQMILQIVDVYCHWNWWDRQLHEQRAIRLHWNAILCCYVNKNFDKILTECEINFLQLSVTKERNQ